MTELVGNNSDHELSDKGKLFSLHDRPTYINEANALAADAELEMSLIKSVGEDLYNARQSIITDLNTEVGIRNQLITVTGKILRRDDALDDNGNATVEPREATLIDKQLESLGYYWILQPEEQGGGVIVRHLALDEPQQIGGNGWDVVTKRNVIEIPIDGSTRVSLVHEVLPPHIELLHETIPDLIDDVDIALDREGSFNSKLLALGQINLAEHNILYGKAGEEIMEQLLYYINSRLTNEFSPAYHLTGTELSMVIPRLDAYVTAKDIDFISHINSIVLSPIDNRQLALSTTTYVEGVGWEQIVHPLSSNLGVTPRTIEITLPLAAEED